MDARSVRLLRYMIPQGSILNTHAEGFHIET